jgi:hypothetical protein
MDMTSYLSMKPHQSTTLSASTFHSACKFASEIKSEIPLGSAVLRDRMTRGR